MQGILLQVSATAIRPDSTVHDRQGLRYTFRAILLLSSKHKQYTVKLFSSVFTCQRYYGASFREYLASFHNEHSKVGAITASTGNIPLFDYASGYVELQTISQEEADQSDHSDCEARRLQNLRPIRILQTKSSVRRQCDYS